MNNNQERFSSKPPENAPRLASRSALAALMLLLAAGGARANGHEALTYLASLNLDDLLKVEVSSVSRKPQTMADTAAAAYVITGEDIRRSGATSIPEALRLAPGLDVARIGSSGWAISSRGFNGRYANKLLVLMDGRTLYTPMFSGVFWNLQDTLMEDIERIEVIRGPGAAMWGANAVNGVINIITKTAKNTQGSMAVAGAGSEERSFAGFRYGGQAGDDTRYRVYGKGFERDAVADTIGQNAHDDWRSMQAGFRMDTRFSGDDRLTVQGDAYQKAVGNMGSSHAVFIPPYTAGFIADDQAKGANLLARWERRLSGQSEFSLQAYYDRAQFTATKLSDVQDTLDVDFQHRLHPNATHDLMWGANFRYIRSATESTPDISFGATDIAYRNISVFAQDDITLAPERLRLTLGAKLENSHFGGTQFQPNARLLWTPDDKNSVWAAVSRAVRTPSRGEADARVAASMIPPSTPQNPTPFPMQLVIGANPDMAAEKLTAYEIGYRAQWNPRLSWDIAAFANYYRSLSQWSAGTPALDFSPVPHLTVPLAYINAGTATKTYGVEMTVDWRALDWMRLEGTYSHLFIDAPPYDGVNSDQAGLSPRNQASLRCLMDLNATTQLDLWLRHVGPLTAQTRRIDGYTSLDARLGWTPHKGLDLSLVGQNLLDSHHPEFSEGAATPTYEIPRGVYVKATWRF